MGNSDFQEVFANTLAVRIGELGAQTQAEPCPGGMLRLEFTPDPRPSADKKRIRELERELLCKDKALAETAALMVLRKKANAIWGQSEGEDE